MKRLLIAILFVACAARASTEACFASFAGMAADDVEAVQLAESTFSALLDLSTDPAVKRRLLEGMVASLDPFKVPQAEPSLGTFGKKLGEFRHMLDTLGWTSPVMTTQLLDSIRRQLGELDHAGETKAEALKSNRGDSTYQFSGVRYGIQSADGRYLIGGPGGLQINGVDQYVVFDTQSQQSTPFPVTPDTHAPIWNGDRTRLVFFEDQGLRVQKFESGSISPELIRFGKPNLFSTWFGLKPRVKFKMQAAANPNWILLQPRGRKGLLLYDIEKRSVRTLRARGHVNHDWGNSTFDSTWGVMAGTNHVVAISNNQGKAYLVMAELNARGRPGTWRELAKWESTEETNWYSGTLVGNRDYVVLPGVPMQNQLTVVSLKDGSTRNFAAAVPNYPDRASNAKVAISPDGKELVLAYDTGLGRGNQTHFLGFELEKGEYLGRFSAPQVHNLTYSADGKALLAGNDEVIKLINHRGRFEK